MRARSCGHWKALLVLVCIAFAQCALAQGQQQQQEDGWDIDTYEGQPEAVPSISARRILQAVTGSYYGDNEAGGYGYYYGNNEAGGYGYYDSSVGFGARRSLIEVASGSYGGYYGNNEAGGYYGNEAGGYYGNNEAGGYYGMSARSMLQLDGELAPVPLPVAEAGPVGQCYCRYESDYNTWALGEEACKNALYAKCKADSRLPCGWLDDYYGTSVFGAQRTGYGLPHESQISAYLFEDCTPMPPCGCSDIAFDGRDDAAMSYKCCRDMRVHCRHPASRLSCAAVTAYCNNDKPSFHLAMWVDRALENAQCDAYHGRPYTFVPFEQMSAAAAAAAVQKLAASTKASASATSTESDELSEQHISASAQKQAAVTPASGISIDVGSVLMVVGGGLVAAALVAAAFAVRRQRLERAAAYQPLLDEHVVAERGMGGQAFVGGLRAPPSAVIGGPAN